MTKRSGRCRGVVAAGMVAHSGLFAGCMDDSGAVAPTGSSGTDASAQSAALESGETITSYEPTIIATDWRVGSYWVYAPSYPTAQWVDITLEITPPVGFPYSVWAGRGSDDSVVLCHCMPAYSGHYSVRARASYWYYDTDYHWLYNSGWGNSVSFDVPFPTPPRIKPELSAP